MNWFLNVVKNKFATFEGRAGREEFWMFTLVYFLIYFVLLALGYMLHATFIAGIFSFAMLVPIIALTARRLHDINRSGWWQLLNFIPIIGWIILLIWYVTDSHSGSNQYGENPKEQTI